MTFLGRPLSPIALAGLLAILAVAILALSASAIAQETPAPASPAPGTETDATDANTPEVHPASANETDDAFPCRSFPG